jgi:transcriptional regulator with XRE-family HTH domain
MQDVSSGDGALSLGRALREQRSRAGLTQLHLARKAGISVGVIRDLEQGVTTRLQPKSLERLAAALGLAPDVLAASADGAEVDRPAGPGGLRQLPSASAAGEASGNGLQIRVLGPLQAWLDGYQVPLGPPRQQAVLALLAGDLGGIVRRETVSEALWGPVPPPTSTAMIHTYVSRLRTILALGRAACATIPRRVTS